MMEPPEEADDERTPRASLVARAGDWPALRGTVWMGGAHTPLGEPIGETQLSRAWLLDCSGDLPAAHVAAAARTLSCVFADLDGRPAALERLEQIVADVAAAIRAGEVADVYVVCQQGMNRSGLVTGLLLRALGLSGQEALERIRRARPGALSNLAFRRLVRD